MSEGHAGLARFNALSEAEARAALLTCCGAVRWAEGMSAARPFTSVDALFTESDRIWFALKSEDWLKAFGHHPRIGERNLSVPKFAATAQQSSREQSGMNGATEAERRAFADGNAEYERRFGHVFLICASGKSSATMLEQLRTRLNNDTATELANAAREQALITRLRLERMLNT